MTSVERRGVITHVMRRTSAAGHEPAAKAFRQRIAVIDVARKTGILRWFRTCRAEHEQSGDAERIARHVAPQAHEGPLELRRVGRIGTLVEGVEDNAFSLVVRRHLEQRRRRAPSRAPRGR